MDEVSVSPHTDASWRDIPARLRHRIQAILQTCIPQDAAPFARALLLGDTTSLSYAVDTSLKISGIRHVAAVSGLHVSILFALLTAITFRKRFLTALAGFPTLLLFAAVAGFTPSVSRSCIMCGLMLAALLLNKEYDGPAGAGLCRRGDADWQPAGHHVRGFSTVRGQRGRDLSLCAGHPQVAGFSVPGQQREGRQTHVDSLVYRFRVHHPQRHDFHNAAERMVFWHRQSCWRGDQSAHSVGHQLYFLWACGGQSGGCVLDGRGDDSWKNRRVADSLCSVDRKVTGGISAGGGVYQKPYITIWLVAVYALLLVFLLSRNRRPGVLLCCGTLGLCLALRHPGQEPMLDSTRITVLDVGQGQCILLQSEGRTYMVDCGGDSDTETADIAAETLLSQGISRLDGLILTHGDRDHTGAAENLLSRVKADVLILPPEEGILVADNAEVVYAEQDLLLTYGKTNLHIFTTDSNRSENENSLCVLFDTENCDILITGDRSAYGERMLLHAGKIPEVDVLIAGHHGSKNSTCEELLAADQPQTVCISAGRDNLYGHPAAETLQRLENFGCTVYRTDRDGTITIRR